MTLTITHVVRSGNARLLAQAVIDVIFVEMAGRLAMNEVAAFGSAELSLND